MTNGEVARKYARALLELSVGKEKLYVENLENVLEVFNNSEELRESIYSYNIPKAIKINIVQDIFSNKIDSVIINFVVLLIKNNRINMLDVIYKDFKKISYKKVNILQITVISPTELEEDIISKIKEKYRLAYNAREVIPSFVIDKNLIGGIKVIKDDEVVDDTIKYKLTQLQKILGGL